MGRWFKTQIIFDPVKESESCGRIRLASQQNPRNFMGTQMRKKPLNVFVNNGKMGIVLFEIGAYEIDYIVRVLSMGKETVKWV